MKFEKTEVWGFGHAIRGMRNPLESWDRIDSDVGTYVVRIGDNDMTLMQKLIGGGSEHRKFMRQIMVSVDIEAPLYWWKEFDTYKVGTVANSASTMHRLASTPIDGSCFEPFHSCPISWIYDEWCHTVETLEKLRLEYNETKNKAVWESIIMMLPESWLQTRTVTMSYENILSMVRQREHHKLTEWSVVFMEWARSLPYAEQLLFIE